MKLSFILSSHNYSIDTACPLDISIPMRFNGPQPNTYDVGPATARAYEAGSFVGDTRRGGGCNFEEYTLIPHCNGTHTECVGHIAHERISIHEVLKETLAAATLITLAPTQATNTEESYTPAKKREDLLLTRKSLEAALAHADTDFLQALIIRTLPNDQSKKERVYSGNPPPFFSLDAMEFIVRKKIKHLLVDIPSVDRTFDEGRLSTHHIFWNVPQGSHDINIHTCSPHTITEMIFVPDTIPDGYYLLNLQTAPFVADAAPSKPVLFEVR